MSIDKIIKISIFIVLSVIAFSCKTTQQGTSDKNPPMPVMQKDTSIIQTIKEQQQIQVTSVSEDSVSYFDENYLRMSNHVYKSNIKTVQLSRSGLDLSYPIIELGKNEKLMLSFDDMEEGIKKYQYTIIHCDANWNPSDLNVADYLSGFSTDEIIDSKSSINTLIPYIHYSLSFPGVNVRPLISGNYILKVFEGDPSNVIITRRFMVAEQLIGIDARVRQATVIEDMKYNQEVIFNITYPDFNILSPFTSLKVQLLQNSRWDNVIDDLKPQYVRNKELVYEYEYGNVFQGDNEYRFFDIKSMKYHTPEISQIILRNSKYHVFLQVDGRRSYMRYIFNKDINGRFVINREEGRDSDTEAEYCMVYFTLPYDVPLVHGQVYIFGELTGWEITDQNKMVYNYPAKTYEKALLLKQGYYNYMYALLENGSDVADLSFIEGTHSQTENDYSILVYYKHPSSNYDRLIGVKYLNSLRQ